MSIHLLPRRRPPTRANQKIAGGVVVPDSQLVSRIRFRAPSALLAGSGLIAWCNFQHGLVRLYGIELRRTMVGEYAISFPPSRVVGDRVSCAAKPVSDPARRAIQAEVLAAAAREGWLP